jgi:type 1 glutamine amidotransferase
LGISLLPPSAAPQDLADASVLVFSKTNGYRHAAIPDGVRALRALANEHGFEVTATEDSTAVRPGRLSAVNVVVFLNTSGDVLGPAGQDALRRFIRDGGGYVGVHAASDTEYDWAWYTAGGHIKASYQAPLFRQHLLGGLQWTAGASSAADR